MQRFYIHRLHNLQSPRSFTEHQKKYTITEEAQGWTTGLYWDWTDTQVMFNDLKLGKQATLLTENCLNKCPLRRTNKTANEFLSLFTLQRPWKQHKPITGHTAGVYASQAVSHSRKPTL